MLQKFVLEFFKLADKHGARIMEETLQKSKRDIRKLNNGEKKLTMNYMTRIEEISKLRGWKTTIQVKMKYSILRN